MCIFAFSCVFFFLDMFVVCLLFVFFFFKQTTAYGMRISDWSSDVCSSDLRLLGQRSLLSLYERSAVRLGIGAALLTDAREVVFANAVLREMQGHGCPLRLRASHVAGTRPEDDAPLQAALDHLLDRPEEDGQPEGIHLLLGARDGAAWSVLAEQVRDPIPADPRARPAVMLLVRAPGHFHPPTADQPVRQDRKSTR